MRERLTIIKLQVAMQCNNAGLKSFCKLQLLLQTDKILLIFAIMTKFLKIISDNDNSYLHRNLGNAAIPHNFIFIIEYTKIFLGLSKKRHKYIKIMK